jgi:hypothetical protein
MIIRGAALLIPFSLSTHVYGGMAHQRGEKRHARGAGDPSLFEIGGSPRRRVHRDARVKAESTVSVGSALQ